MLKCSRKLFVYAENDIFPKSFCWSGKKRGDGMRLFWIAAGGFAGSVLRALLGKWLPVSAGFPFPTLVANLVGCWLLGMVMGMVLERKTGTDLLKYGAGTGFCGGLTTFSTLSAEGLNMIERQEMVIAVLYVLGSVSFGMFFAERGLDLGRRWMRMRGEGQ
jgi:CrcB protein